MVNKVLRILCNKHIRANETLCRVYTSATCCAGVNAALVTPTRSTSSSTLIIIFKLLTIPKHLSLGRVRSTAVSYIVRVHHTEQEAFFTHWECSPLNPRSPSCPTPSGPPAKRMNHGYKHGNSFSSRRPLLIMLLSPCAPSNIRRIYTYAPTAGNTPRRMREGYSFRPAWTVGFRRRVLGDRRWGRKRDRRSIWNYIDQQQITARRVSRIRRMSYPVRRYSYGCRPAATAWNIVLSRNSRPHANEYYYDDGW